MDLSLTRRFGRPSWMTPLGSEGWGDVFFDRLWPEWRRDMGEEWTPSIDLSEKDGKYTLKAELPGLSKDDITISLNEGYVTISGKRESEKEEEDRDYHMKEMRCGSFSRSLRLPKEIDSDHVDATFKDGVLTVVLPQKETSETKKIEIH